MRIGLIGAGLMGHGIGLNLLKHGHELRVLAHRDRAGADDLIAKGAREAASPEAMAAAAEMVILCVSTAEVVQSLMMRMATHLKPGSLVIDCGTTRPDVTAELAHAMNRIQIGYADAPLTGGPEQAAKAELGALVGAEDDVFARIEPILACFASTIRHFGPPGSGHTAKLISNYLVTGMVALVVDAFTTASSAGIAWDDLYTVMLNGSGNSGVLRKLVAPALEGDFGGYQFALGNAAKDIGYYGELAGALQRSTPLSEAVETMFARALEERDPSRPVSDLLRPPC